MNNSSVIDAFSDTPNIAGDDDFRQAAAEESASYFGLDATLTPTPSRKVQRQRLQSDESRESDSSKATSLGYCDSGHYSSANVSDSQPLLTSTHTHDVLRQKDQALFLALQDVRRLRSELERLSKSEKWYKHELRQQKHARLEALEKLYGNERNYMQENQRLQRECLRLYARCGDIERELEQQRAKQSLLARQKEQEAQLRQGHESASHERDFEYEQQQALIADQQQLIEVLRKQKRALLVDFKRLNEEKDAQIYELQRNIAMLEAENLQVTKKCKTLLDERSLLEETIIQHGNELLALREEQQRLEQSTQANQLTIAEQQRELVVKEKEVLELQRNFKQALQNEIEPDAIHRLSLDYHKDILEKTHEIMSLKNAQQSLQQELEVLSELQAQNEQQQRELEHLEAALADKNCELREMQECDAKKCAEIAALKAEIAEYQNMTRSLEQREQQRQDSYAAEMLLNQEAIKSVESELINANQRYANMCVLCERTRFELDMREKELRKLQFEKSRDVVDVQQLRAKLSNYLQQTKELSGRINELEEELGEQRREKEVLKEEKGTRCSVLEQIRDELMEEHGCEIKQENFSFVEEDTTDGHTRDVREDEESAKLVFEAGRSLKQEAFNEECENWLKSELRAESFMKEERSKEEREDLHKSGVRREEESKGHVLKTAKKSKDTTDAQDLREMDVKILEMMAFLNRLEDENKDLKNFILERVEEDAAKSQDECGMYGKETKMQHLEEDFKTSHDYKPHHQLKTEEADFEELKSKLETMHEYLKEMEKENFELKKLVKDYNKEAQTDQDVAETQLKKVDLRLKPQITQQNPNSVKQTNASLPVMTAKKEIPKGGKKPLKQRESSPSRDANFEIVSSKLQETHQLVEELQTKNNQLKQLLEQQTEANVQVQANEVVLQELKQDFKLLKAENAEKTAQIINLQTELDASQASCDNLVKEQQQASIKLTEITSLNTQNSAAYEQAAAELKKSTAKINTLQIKLLENDAKLYKLQRVKQQLEHYLEEAQKQLQQQLPLAQQEQQKPASTSATQANKQQQQLPAPQQEQQQSTEQKSASTSATQVVEPEQSAYIFSAENDTAELLGLRVRVASLEQELKQAYSDDNQQRSERIELLNKLLEQQNQKVTQLNAAQADWEELLNQLNAAHAQEAATSAELQQKRADLEELNELFHKQNFELQTLYHINQNQDNKKDRELQALQKTCEQQQAAMKTQADLIETLHLKNQHLEKTINEDYATEVGEHKKELRSLRQQVTKFSQERQDDAARMQEMEKELSDLRKAKRQAIMEPQLVFPDSITTYDDSPSSHAESGEECNSNVDDHLRILTKVLEHEYKRKSERSELHISTLLSNIKRLKRALVSKEQEVCKLQAQKSSSSEREEELQYTRRQLLEMRQRYEQSQNALKTLEHQLAALRQQYEATDSGKSSSNESAHEVANLIDDYKKLIQQSATVTKRPKTSTILDLIQRSNQSVPNLNKLESSIVELRHDIQQYIGASQGALSLGNFSTQAYRQPSLLDELHQAAAAHA